MKTIAISFLLYTCCSALAQPAYTDSARVGLLEKIVAIQAQFRELKSTQDFLMQDSMQYDPDNYSEYQSLLKPSAWAVTGIDSSLSRLGITAYTMGRVPAVPQGYIVLSSEPTFYSLATAKSGAIFLLRGFWKNDFATMVKQEFGNRINRSLAISLGVFYISNVVYPLGMGIVDTSTSESQLAKFKVKVHYPTARVDEKGDFHVSICDVQPKSNVTALIGEFVERRFVFGKNGSFECLHPKILGTFTGSPQVDK